MELFPGLQALAPPTWRGSQDTAPWKCCLLFSRGLSHSTLHTVDNEGEAVAVWRVPDSSHILLAACRGVGCSGS